MNRFKLMQDNDLRPINEKKMNTVVFKVTIPLSKYASYVEERDMRIIYAKRDIASAKEIGEEMIYKKMRSIPLSIVVTSEFVRINNKKEAEFNIIVDGGDVNFLSKLKSKIK